jgi:hypothetical protein
MAKDIKFSEEARRSHAARCRCIGKCCKSNFGT